MAGNAVAAAARSARRAAACAGREMPAVWRTRRDRVAVPIPFPVLVDVVHRRLTSAIRAPCRLGSLGPLSDRGANGRELLRVPVAADHRTKASGAACQQ